MFRSAAEVAHRHGLSQEALSELVGVVAAQQAENDRQWQDVLARERAAIGGDVEGRINGLMADASKAGLGELLDAFAKPYVENTGLLTRSQIRALENLIMKVGGQVTGGGAGQPMFNSELEKLSPFDRMVRIAEGKSAAQPRPQARALSMADLEKMAPFERMAYLAQNGRG
jgi:hypothetical protein